MLISTKGRYALRVMKACPAERLRQVKISLAAGNPMEQQDGGMRTRFSGGIEYGQQPAPLAGNQNPVDIRAAVAAVPRSLTSRKHAHSQ